MTTPAETVRPMPAQPLRPGPLVATIAALLAAAFIAQEWFGLIDRWELSPASIAAGRYGTLLSSMIAHAGLVHLGANSVALLAFGSDYRARMGDGPAAGAALVLVLLLGGIAGGFMFLALAPAKGVAAVGFSGAICALWGLNARLPPGPGRALPLLHPQVRMVARQFIVMNLVLVVLFALMGGGLGWHAHLGGFLFGLAAAPFAVRAARR